MPLEFDLLLICKPRNKQNMENKTMAATMTPTMNPENAHKEIPGNPSTAKSSQLRLNDRSNGKPLQLLTEEDWKFWIHNGYIVIKNAVPKEQASRLAEFLWEFEEKDATNPETWYAPPRAEMKMKEFGIAG